VRTVFFGTSAFAVPSLQALVSCTQCSLVVTQPDRPAGRGLRLRSTPVKSAARELGIPTIEPQHLLREAVPELLAEPFDLFAVASYGKIVPQWILDLPRLGALNVHPSLLPLYRGATPLQSQIRDGVVESGVTIIMMDAGMDTGDVVLQERNAIEEGETYGALHDRFARVGADLLKRAIEHVRTGTGGRTPQKMLGTEEQIAVTLTRTLRKEDSRLDSIPYEERTMSGIVNKIRSWAPKAQESGGGVPEIFENNDAEGDAVASISMKLLAAHALPEGPSISLSLFMSPERWGVKGIIFKGWILIRALDGWVVVDELREQGGRAMSIRQFRSGHRECTLLHKNLRSLEARIENWYEKSGKAALQHFLESAVIS
jgi:methionyl-tRNA formyltransferase